VQHHSSQTVVSRLDCLPLRPTLHCRNRGVSVPKTPPAIAEYAVRLIDKCCGCDAVRRSSGTWFWKYASSLMHRSRCKYPGHALMMLAWRSHCQLSVQPFLCQLAASLCISLGREGVCVHALPWVQLSNSMGNGRPHNVVWPGGVMVSTDAPIINIDRLSSFLPIISVGHLLRRYQPTVVSGKSGCILPFCNFVCGVHFCFICTLQSY